jgi:hypothetical protein
MAYFDDSIDSNLDWRKNFKGYVGNPPSNKDEYNSLDCWKNQDIKPSWEEIQNSVKMIEVQQKRSVEYPMLEEQLDMLYHDIKSGNLNSGTWIEKIEEIKNRYPKPKQ